MIKKKESCNATKLQNCKMSMLKKDNAEKITMLQNRKALSCKGAKLQRRNAAKAQSCKDAMLQRCNAVKWQFWKITMLQNRKSQTCKASKLQSCEVAKLQSHKAAKLKIILSDHTLNCWKLVGHTHFVTGSALFSLIHRLGNMHGGCKLAQNLWWRSFKRNFLQYTKCS